VPPVMRSATSPTTGSRCASRLRIRPGHETRKHPARAVFCVDAARPRVRSVSACAAVVRLAASAALR
jgi:hypothetical protein